jgi:hypothetical protein
MDESWQARLHDPQMPVPHLSAVHVTQAPVVDGVLDDAAWEQAAASSAFTQKSPREGAPPTERTTVRVVYDDDALYVAVDCAQAGAPIVARLTRRDREVEADWVSVAFDTRRDGKSAFVFEVNAGGAMLDAMRFNDTDFSPDWDENWNVRVSRRSDGWSAEYRIPLRVLRFQSLPQQSWGFEVRRYISIKQETDEWALVPRSGAGEVSHYGKLDGLLGLASRTPFELRPFVLGRMRRRDATTLDVNGASGSTFMNALPGGTDFTGSAGLDLKWHPTQDLTLDATVNPDFAQVEADQIVLNLTTYETYYPEKRPFFLEGIDAFATPLQLVYTRRIGRAPSVPYLRDMAPYNEMLLDVPQPATIWGASKLTGRVADGWSIGTLQAVTAESTVPVQLADGTRVNRVLAPLTDFGVLRVKRDLSDHAFVGLTATGVTHAERTGQWPIVPGAGPATQLCPDGAQLAAGSRCFDDAYVAAADWRWRSGNGDWASNGQLVASTLQHGPARSVSDGTSIAPGDVGHGAQGYFAKEGGAHWVGDVFGAWGDRKLDINDLGYLQRANIWGGGFDLEYRTLQPTWNFLETHTNFSFWRFENDDGLLLRNGYQINAWGKLSNFWRYYGNVAAYPPRFDDREMTDGAALERAGKYGGELEVISDSTKRVSFDVWTGWFWLPDGYIVQGNAAVTLRALPQLDLDLLPTWQLSPGEPRYVTTGPLAGQYVFGHLDAKSFGTTLRATYTFTPRLTLQTYAQLFLASGHYSGFTFYQSDPNGPRPVVHLGDLRAGPPPPTNPDFEQGAINANVVLRWEYQIGSLLYVVYTRSQVPSVSLGSGERGTLDLGAVRRAPASDTIIVKLSYWWG